MTSESNKQKNLRLNTLLDHVHTFMKAIIVFILSCLSVFAADTNDTQVVTWTYKIMPEGFIGHG